MSLEVPARIAPASPDMPSAEFHHYGREVVDWMAGYLRDIADYPVLPSVQPGDLKAQLAASAPEQGEAMDAILRDFRDLIVPANTNWNHPRFHGYFSISASGPGILAEMLMAALNVNGMVWKSSPAATELEQRVLDWLRQWIGLPEGNFGIIHDTASISTLHALAAAREYKDPDSKEEGARPGLVVYTSEQAHSSVEKAALALGFGRRYFRKIPVDADFRMRTDALEAALKADREAGLTPCCIVPTTGTTGTTAIDPVPAVAKLAQEYDAWLHVDAAYGGCAAIAPEFAHVLAGAEHADSLVVNPHKWLFTPVDCSVLYTRRPDIFRRAFSLIPEYLRTGQDDQVLNFMDYAVPLGRRFRSLKLWFVMRYFGRERSAGIIRSHMAYAQQLKQGLEADGRFEIAAPVPLSLVCFRLKSDDAANARLMDAVNASGQAFLSHTSLEGRYVIRCAIGNVRTTAHDIDVTLAAIRKAADSLGD
jgi:aromatic-L-amino-acid/L-tryptophan decarboxylase